jgi:putative acetyltransferase
LKIIVDDLSGPQIAALLTEHLDEMRATSPPESKHALDLDDLRRPEVTFWSALDGDEVIGCGAIKRLDATHAEVKSMRTARSRQGGGVASALLTHLLDEARRMGFRRVSLETGSAEFFAPARRLYRRFGFADCEPFGDYRPDPHSVFLTREL